jgi:hypothetical protein
VIGCSKVNERLPDITSYRIPLDVSESQKKIVPKHKSSKCRIFLSRDEEILRNSSVCTTTVNLLFSKAIALVNNFVHP